MSSNLILNSLVMQSALYNLPDQKERQRSNTELANLFANIIVNGQIDSFFEIGALYAEFSMFIKDRVKNVYAFEASPRNYDLAKDKIEGINYLNLAVSSYDGEININMGISEGANIGADSVLDRIDNGSTEYEKKTVECIKLDTFAENNNLTGTSKAMWIDVEGNSLSVLNGAKSSLISTQVIFIEMEQVAFWENQSMITEVNEFLCNYNFVPIARDFEYENQFNVVYVKRDILYSPSVDISLQMFYVGMATKGSQYVQKI